MNSVAGWNSILSLNSPTCALVLGQQPHQELLGAFLHQIERAVMLPLVSIITMVVIGVGLFSKMLIGLQLPVVEDLEVVLHEIGDEPPLQIRDRHVHGDGRGGDLELLLRRGHHEGDGRERQGEK